MIKTRVIGFILYIFDLTAAGEPGKKQTFVEIVYLKTKPSQS